MKTHKLLFVTTILLYSCIGSNSEQNKDIKSDIWDTGDFITSSTFRSNPFDSIAKPYQKILGKSDTGLSNRFSQMREIYLGHDYENISEGYTSEIILDSSMVDYLIDSLKISSNSYRDIFFREHLQRAIKTELKSRSMFWYETDAPHFSEKLEFEKYINKLYTSNTTRMLKPYLNAEILVPINMPYSIFAEDVQVSYSIIDSSVCFKHSSFLSDVNFLRTSFKSSADFSSCQFNKNSEFSNARFNSIVDFSQSTFNQNASFEGVQFDSIANFSNVEFRAKVSFNNCMLPGFLNFSGVKIPSSEIIDLTSCKYEHPTICLTNSSIENIKFRYDDFNLIFADSTSSDQTAVTYEKLLETQHKYCFLSSYEKLDKEYSEFKFLKSGLYTKFSGYILNVFNKLWWGYGYDKILIFRNTFFIFLFFSVINALFFNYVSSNIYQVPHLLKLRIGIISKNAIVRFFKILPLAIFYTGLIFFGIKFNLDNLKYKENLVGLKFVYLIYFFLIYTLGLICIGYIANFVLSN